MSLQDEKYAVTVDFVHDEVEVTAVFTSEMGRNGDLTCYSHNGQHSTCSLAWYQARRKATPEEHAGLLGELDGLGYDITLF